jgi:hypothetical protein
VRIESVRIGSQRMLDGSEPGTDRWAAASLEDSIERIVPEIQQDGDRDLLIAIIDVDEIGVRAGDTEVCAMGAFRVLSTGEEHEFFGCDTAVVEP